ncbi:MAG: TerB family tellurite resistance protein [Deltaproteobacteria bacterium]|nr:TerB family tellurite resistance protein [Deltaproteobacteria bacterium]
MGWFGKLTFGSLGLFLAGPLGAIAGAALGHHLIDKKENYTNQTVQTRKNPPLGQREQIQAAYFVSMFSILGKLAKIDGIVTKDEIIVVDNFINKLPITSGEKQFARQVFSEAKDSGFSIEDFAIQLYRILNDQPTVLLTFFEILFQVAAADSNFHPNEEAALKKIKDTFNISNQQYANIRSLYFKDIDRFYSRLNCTPESSEQEIKSSHKKLVKDFHPDTIVSKGLPEEFMDFATKRFREIQEAYEEIRQERNF